ncbi:hypothetical protein PFY01_05065 [Brevundimonas vesicularis]|uniref:hypothetical protein n=1 Tax=Brevundimonas vesicularis TaxID=41276 RepID=UPI0022EC2AFB|nr:hypothetical protein [Brevundimonas vesicularis]WBT07063.1 hypothetical protein PFY01_05065 [Brevundimonas vesicularis]
MALIGGCSSPPQASDDVRKVGGRSFRVPSNVVVNPTPDSLAFYMRGSDFGLLDEHTRGERLFIQIQSDRQPDVASAIVGLRRHGGVLGREVYGGLTPVSGAGEDAHYFIQNRYGGASIFCPVDGWECRARVPYRDLSISIRFPQARLSSWMSVIDGVLTKVESLEV